MGPARGPDRVRTFDDLRTELRKLRVTAARGRRKTQLSLQDIAAASGVPRSSLANYLSGATLLPADQLDAIVLALGVTTDEASAWARAWERAMEHRFTAGAPAPPDTSRSLNREPEPAPGAGATAADLAHPPARSHRTIWAVVAVTAVAVLVGTQVLRSVGVPKRLGVALTPPPSASAPPRPNCRPVTGDWNGRSDGARSTGVGLACKQGAGVAWTVANGVGAGAPRAAGGFGNSDWCLPVAGDWDGDGRTSAGTVCPSGGNLTWTLADDNRVANYPPFAFGAADTYTVSTGWAGPR